MIRRHGRKGAMVNLGHFAVIAGVVLLLIMLLVSLITAVTFGLLRVTRRDRSAAAVPSAPEREADR